MKNFISRYKIKTTNWVKQAADGSPLHICGACWGLTKTLKEIEGESFGLFFTYFKKGEGEVYFPQDKINRLGDLYLRRKKTINRIYKNWLKLLEKIKKESLKIKKTDLTRLSDKALLDYCLNFFQFFLNGWAKSGFVEVYDNTSEQIIEKVLRKAKLKKPIRDKEKDILLSPYELSLFQQERLNFLEIIDHIKKRHRKVNPDLFQKDKKIKSLIKKHVNKFFFIKGSYYSGEELTEKEIVKRIIKDFNKIDVRKELKSFENLKKSYRGFSRAKAKIFKGHNFPPDLRFIFNLFSLSIKWRDERKKMHQLGAIALEKMVGEIAGRADIPGNLIRYLMVQELQPRFSDLKKLIPILQKRKKESMLIFDEFGNLAWLFEKSARRLKEELDKTIKVKSQKIISGKPAYKGKVRGIIKIIKSVKKFGEFKKGNILVTSMTRPEFIPVVRKAKAIITDEGGITCHAAIISRELSVPCIIGTKIATRVLRDGDLVEVDAEKGIVKILEKLNK